LGLAALSKLPGIGLIGAFSIAPILNLVLFLIAFRLFVWRLLGNRIAPFYYLLFVLVLWRVAPWRWSAFLNLNLLGFGLPYPSMFATAITLLTLWTLMIFLESHRLPWLLGPVIGGSVILLTHPISTLAAGIAAAAVVANGNTLPENFPPVKGRTYDCSAQRWSRDAA
jgi:hypothetical protein